MKQHTIALSAFATVLTTLGGCSQQEASSTPTAPPAQHAEETARPATQAVPKASDSAQGQTQVVKEKAQEVVAQAQTQLQEDTSKVQGVIEKVRTLLAEKKWTEALSLLNELSGQPLAPDQQSAVQALTQQAQTGAETAAKTKATDEATKAVGSLFEKKL